MIVVILVSLLAILLTRLEETNRMKNGLFYGFVLITILGALHYNYGNDYHSYQIMFNEITANKFYWSDILDGSYNKEPGWVVLNFVFKRLGGFFVMVAFLNIFQNAVIYHFIKSNVDKSWWTMAISIYLLTPQLYLYSFSMMRQFLAVTLFLLAWDFIFRKRFIIAFAIILLGSFMHNSCQLLLPFAFLYLLPLKNKKIVVLAYVVIFIALYASSELLGDVFDKFASIEELESTKAIEIYGTSNNSFSLGLGFVLNMIPYLLGLWVLLNKGRSLTEREVGLIVLMLMGMLIVPFGQISHMIGRFSFYFMIYEIAAMPLVYSKLTSLKIKQLLLFIFVFMLVTSYFRFFMSPVWQPHYSTYHTIFETF